MKKIIALILSINFFSMLAYPCVQDPYYYPQTIDSFIFNSNMLTPFSWREGSNGVDTVDLGIISDLNKESAQVFDLMVKCSNNDPEIARKVYVKLLLKCDKDLKNLVESRFKKLKEQVYNFLLTSEINPIEIESQQFNAHPLFVQFVMEFSSTILRFSNNSALELEKPQTEWIDQGWDEEFNKKVQSLLPPQHILKEAQHINYDDSMAKDPIGTQRLLESFLSANKETSSLAFSVPRLYKNSIILLSKILDKKNCSNYGLWEELGRKYAFIVSKLTSQYPIGMSKYFAGIHCEKDDLEDTNIYSMKALNTNFRPEYIVAFFRSLAKQKKWNLNQVDFNTNKSSQPACLEPVDEVVKRNLPVVNKAEEDIENDSLNHDAAFNQLCKAYSTLQIYQLYKRLESPNKDFASAAICALEKKTNFSKYDKSYLIGNLTNKSSEIRRAIYKALYHNISSNETAYVYDGLLRILDPYDVRHKKLIVDAGYRETLIYAINLLGLIKSKETANALMWALRTDGLNKDRDVISALFDSLENQTKKDMANEFWLLSISKKRDSVDQFYDTKLYNFMQNFPNDEVAKLVILSYQEKYRLGPFRFSSKSTLYPD